MSKSEITSEAASEKLGEWLSNSVIKDEDENLLEMFSDSFEDISSWVSQKFALNHTNTKLQSVIYLITNYAILETAEHVFSIGSGFVKADMTGFTLTQILQTVQRIEGKVDTMLKEPLNSAIDFFDSAILEIKRESFKDAYNSLDKVIENATKAF